MLLLRSLSFNVLFYANLIAQMIVLAPFYFLAPRRKAWAIPKNWARSNLWLQRMLVGTRYSIEGLENMPHGAAIIAPKHQSFWDVFAFLPFIPDAVMILKRELMWIPLFGWYVAKMRMVPIDRGSRVEALKQMIEDARKAMAEGRQILIYPEGTRRPPGAPPQYKHGVARLYEELGLPVVAVAHDAGLYWPRRRFMRYPGTIRCRVLPPIMPGLDRESFLRRLTEITEAACDEFLVAAARDPSPPPMPPTAIERLRALGVSLPAG